MESVKHNSENEFSQIAATNSRHEEIIEHLQTCCLCGGQLDYHHETDYMYLTVKEEAHCHSCGVRTKKESHTIQ